MSIHRDQAQDLQRTREVMAGGNRTDPNGTNWLGHRHGTAAEAMDNMLVDGATWQDLMQARDTEEASQQHLRHLEEAHGLTYIQRADGRYVFDV